MIQPMDDKIFIRPRSTMESAILELVEMNDNRSSVADVVMAGPLKSDLKTPSDVEDGDVVVYMKYAGEDIQIDGQKMTVIQYKDLRAIIKEEE